MYSDRLYDADAELLPVQYYDILRHKAAFDGEKQLLCAVLENGIDEFVKNLYQAGAKATFYEDAKWLLNERRDDMYSFNGLCLALDVDAGTLREGILRLASRAKRLYPGRARVTPKKMARG